MAKKQTLGRGFDVLIPKDLDSTILEEDKSRVQKILISDIVPNPDQPRREFEEAALTELTTSIKRHGVLQPILVVRRNNGYRIVAGERRWRAAKAASLTHIPAIVRSLEELEQIELGLIENIQRVDLSPLEQALSVYRLQHQFNLSLNQIAEKLGKAPSTLSNLTRLLNLPPEAMEALRLNKISEGHARAVLALKDYPAKQMELLSCITNNNWNVRQAEKFVTDAKKASGKADKSTQAPSDADLAVQLNNVLRTPVKIKRQGAGGQIIISFKSDNILNKIKQKILNNTD